VSASGCLVHHRRIPPVVEVNDVVRNDEFVQSQPGCLRMADENFVLRLLFERSKQRLALLVARCV
jgi:hypothetical protein